MLEPLLYPVSWNEVGEAGIGVIGTEIPDNVLKEKVAGISAVPISS